MHWANLMWWSQCQDKYPQYFNNASVLEFGSHNICGTIRDHFTDCPDYVGCDWRAGRDVDLVALNHDVDMGRQFDMVACAGTLEHDPYWRQSIPNMIRHMKDDAIFIITWGTARVIPHLPDISPEGKFHRKPVKPVLDFFEGLDGIYVHQFKYEGRLPGYLEERDRRDGHENSPDGLGNGCILAFKDPSLAVGLREIDELVPEDMNEDLLNSET